MAEVYGPEEWRHQALARLNQALPVQNTWYTVLPATGRYTLLHFVGMLVAVANETLEVEITIDGLTLTRSISATAGTYYMTRWDWDCSTGTQIGISVATLASPFMIGHNVGVRVRKTTALGAGNLMAKAIYAVA